MYVIPYHVAVVGINETSTSPDSINSERVDGIMEEQNVIDYTDILTQIYGEMQTQTEVLQRIERQNEYVSESIGGLEIMFAVGVVFAILDFCWACMRQWRKNILKLGGLKWKS